MIDKIQAATVPMPSRSETLTILPPTEGDSLLLKNEREVIDRQQINVTIGENIPDILEANLPRAGNPSPLNDAGQRIMGNYSKLRTPTDWR